MFERIPAECALQHRRQAQVRSRRQQRRGVPLDATFQVGRTGALGWNSAPEWGPVNCDLSIVQAGVHDQGHGAAAAQWFTDISLSNCRPAAKDVLKDMTLLGLLQHVSAHTDHLYNRR